MLRARSLAFGYPGRPVGEIAALDLAAGEVTVLLGPNGSGKTTLLRTLLGLLPPLAGDVLLDSKPMAACASRDRARRLGYVPQATQGNEEFTLEEVVAMGRTAHGGLFSPPARADRQAVAHALDRLRLVGIAERLYGEVSGGEQQLALIARALAGEAELLVMDEPTANLDFANQGRVLDEIARLRDAGIGVLFTTHHPDQALRIADRAVLLKAGRVLAAGSAAATINSENLSALYGSRVHVAEVRSPDGRSARVVV